MVVSNAGADSKMACGLEEFVNESNEQQTVIQDIGTSCDFLEIYTEKQSQIYYTFRLFQ